MHQIPRGMQHRHRRVQGLEEREPALIDLPFALPSIPLLSPLLDPILTPIIAGKPRTTTTSTPHATTSTTPAQAPAPSSPPATTTPSNPAPAPSSSANGSSGDSGNSGSGSGNGSDTGNGNGASPSNGSNGSNPSQATTAPAFPAASSSAGSSGSSDPSGSSDASPSKGSDAGSDASASGSSSGSSPEDFSDASSTGSLSLVINANGGQAFATGTGSGDAAEETGSGGVTGTAAHGTSVGAAGRLTGTFTGLYPGATTGTSSADPSNPTGTVDAASGSHGLSTGIIVAISVIAALLALMLLLCCVRRRAVAARVKRRKQWFAGSGAGAEKDFNDKDALAPGTHSNRSSFATSYDRGQVLFSPNPFHANELVAETAPVWPSDLSGSITVAPAAAHTVESSSSPTFRSTTDRSSIHSSSSAGSSRPPSQDSQYLVALPPAAAAEGQPYGMDCPSPFSVRPFSPSETFSFPQPPKDDAQSRASEMVSGSVKSSVLGSAFFTAEEAYSPSAENENPFADFTEVGRPPSAATDSSVPQHFAPVETIRRPFVPSMNDELAVSPGDEVRILKRFDDGWAVAEKVGAGVQGLIPIDCMRAVEEELPAFLAKKRISSYLARASFTTRASVLSGGSSIGAAM